MTPRIPDWNTLTLVLPEIWLALGMCAVLLVAFIRRNSVALPAAAALASLTLAVAATVASFARLPNQPIFHGMLSVDPFSQFFKILLLVFVAMVVVQWLVSRRHMSDPSDSPDFLCLLLGATFGMALMSSANNLLMILIATESASLPSFALAGWRKRLRVGSEGSLKYVIFGSAASAVGVYGMSLIYGVSGSLDLPTIAAKAVEAQGVSPLLAVGLLAMFSGIAFKLSAVPMHFWCPDVFQGAPVSVTTFLSVASKGGAICLLVRVMQVFGAAAAGTELFTGMGVGIAILGAVTATWGNLVALHQTNIKRLLAYSSIAHAGYMIMAASLVLFAHQEPSGDLTPSLVVGALLFYLLVYLFMNLGAFTVAAVVAQRSGQEELTDYAGLIRRSPVLAVMLTLFLLSLFGMPGLGGFMGKVYFMVAMSKNGAGFVLIVVLLLNTLVSLYYYLKPAYYMAFRQDESAQADVPSPAGAGGVLGLCATMVLLTGLLPGLLAQVAMDHATLLQPGTRESGRVTLWSTGGESGQGAPWPRGPVKNIHASASAHLARRPLGHWATSSPPEATP